MSKEDKPDAWMPLYIGDWDGDTGHLDCEQDGAYGRLIRWYWRNGPPPDDDASLSRIVRMQLARWRKTRPMLAPFFVIKDGKWTHKRVDAELVKWAAKKVKAVERAKSAANRRWKGDAQSNATSNAPGTPQALLEQCPSASAGKVEGPKEPSTLSDASAVALAAGSGAPVLRLVVPEPEPPDEEILFEEHQRIDPEEAKAAFAELIAGLGSKRIP